MWWLRKNFGWLAALTISFYPIVIWVSVQPLQVKLSTFSGILTSLGQLTGLVGMAMFAVAMILSARVKFMGTMFRGMNRVYQAHHTLGISAFLILLVHPIALALVYSTVSLRSAALFLLPGRDWARSSGVYAIIILAVLLVVTLFAKFRYQILKSFHQFLGVAFTLSSAHTLLIPSDVTRFPPLLYYMLALIILGHLAYVYRTILSKFTVKYYKYVVTKIERAPSNMAEITMMAEDKPLTYMPSQFIFVSFLQQDIGPEKHPFSITSSPYDDQLSIVVKSLGDYTSRLTANLQAGTKAKIEGPYGNFIYFHTFRRANKKQIWIAGGSGIAPFLGMARNLYWASTAYRDRAAVIEYDGYMIELYYSAKSKSELAYLEELNKIGASLKSFRVIPFSADEQGFLTADKIMEMSKGISGKAIFICGPPPMMNSLKKQFFDLDIPSYRIHTEEFRLL